MPDEYKLVDAMMEFLPDDEWDQVWRSGSIKKGWRLFRPLLIDGTVVATGIKHGLQHVGKIDSELWESYQPRAQHLRDPDQAGYDSSPRIGFWAWYYKENPETPPMEELGHERLEEIKREFKEKHPKKYAAIEPKWLTEGLSNPGPRWLSGKEQGQRRKHPAKTFMVDVEPRKRGTPIWDDDKLLESVFWNETTGLELRGVRFFLAKKARGQAGGRPSKAHRIQPIIDQLLGKGEHGGFDSWAAMARAVCEQDRTEHPTDQAIAVSTIEKMIRTSREA